jgi:mRNA interferase MazF
MKRGDLVTVAMSDDFGKPRPAIIIQSDHFAATDTVTLVLLSSTLVDAPLIRIIVHPTPRNGLRAASQIMIDKTMTVRRERIEDVFGHTDEETMTAVSRSLAVFFGIA